MAYSYVTYTGNGSTTQFAVPFGYIRKEHIEVLLNDVATTAYTWVSASTIQMNTAPGSGVVVKLLRETPVDASLVDFTDGSTPVARDFDTANTQNLYTNQELRDISDATDALSNQALTTANNAVTTANGAVTTANAASTAASNAVTTANAANATAGTANSNSTAAVSTANQAAANAAAAVVTANAASASASSAVSTANTAASNASAAVSTANSASTASSNAVTTANNAVTVAQQAVNTANSANTTAGSAVTTANSAVSTANSASTAATNAVNTANTANTKSDQAIAAVANAILYDLVANVAAIPASPANNDAVEVFNSTGIESFTPLANKPAGFVGDSGLSVRIVYSSTGSTWNWVQYFPNDPETRYGDAITALETDVLGLDSAKLDATTAASTYLSISTASSTYAPKVDASLTGLTLIELAGVKDAVRLSDADESHYIGLKAPSVVGANVTFVLPATDGTNGQVLKTNGSAGLDWVTLDPGVTLVDGGNFANGTSTVDQTKTINGGSF
jgi:hypothetical protein